MIPKSIIATAKAVLEAHPTCASVYVTEDGNAFLGDMLGRNHAQLHARSRNLPEPVTVTREEAGLKPVEEPAQAQPATTAPANDGEPEGTDEAARDAGAQAGSDAAEGEGAQEATAEAGLVVVRGVELLGDKVSLKKGKEVPAVDVLNRAFLASGLTAEGWNAQDDDTILDKLFEAIEALKKTA